MLNRIGPNVSFNEFIEAAKTGGDAGLVIVNRYIQQNRDNVVAINAATQLGNTALIWAAYKGHTAIVTALLAKEGIAINAANQDGNTALICAANNGHTAIVTALLAKEGIAINAANQDGNTALICAANNGHTAIVTALLPRLNLVDIAHQNHNHHTAAQLAEQLGHHGIAALIVAREQELRVGLVNGDAILPERNAAPNRVIPVSFTPQERLERIKFMGEVPIDLVCPIAQDGRLMIDPITVKNGITFERENLRRWCTESLNAATRTFPCPVTRDPVHESELTNKSTILVKNMIDNFVKAEVVKDASEKKDVKDVMDELIQKIQMQESLSHFSKDESTQEERVRPADEQYDDILLPSISSFDSTFEMNSVVNNQSSSSSSSSSSSVHQQTLETEKMRVARKRLEFFESQRRNKINNNGITALPSDRSVANASVSNKPYCVGSFNG